MIEVTVLNYLERTMECPVYAEEPDKAPARYLVIEKTGSSAEENCLFTSMIAIKSYGTGMLDSMQLNEEVKEAMFLITTEPDVTDISLNSDYNFSDTLKKKYRYQAVFDITHY